MIQSSDLLLNHVSKQGYCIKLLSSFNNYYLVIISILSAVKEGQATPQFSMKDWKSKARSGNRGQFRSALGSPRSPESVKYLIWI